MRRFVIGVDKSRMKLYDVEQEAQDDILDGPKHKSVMDNTKFGERYEEEFKMAKKFDKATAFEGFR